MNRFNGKCVAVAALAGLMGMMLSVVGCGGGESGERSAAANSPAPVEKPADHHADHQPTAAEDLKAPMDNHGTEIVMEVPFKEVFEDYLAIQVALGNDSLKGVSEKAKSIVSAVESDRSGKLSSSLALDAKALISAKDLEIARTAFSNLGVTLTEDLEKRKVTGSGLVLVYCPLVKKTWLQTGDHIHNPYAGVESMTCGEVKKKF